jgi:hypothetical protein
MNESNTPVTPSPETPPRPKKGVSTGCALAIIAVFLGGAAVLESLVYDNHSKGIHPKAEMKGLEIAIKSYKTEYMRLPFIGETPPSQDNQAYDTSDANGRKLLDILLARDTKHNPRQIRFWEPPTAKRSGAGYSSEGGLKDSWGKQGYKVILDYNGDGKITNPYGKNDKEADELDADVIIYSAGANGIFEQGVSKNGKGTDDVKSWW